MKRDVFVHFLPELADPADFEGGVVVVIDVLRASTTIVHALAAGAAAVVPCCEVDEARELANQFPAESVLLGGERDGLLIEGFHLDNSPTGYTTEVVADKTIVFTTTNGTRAMQHASAAERIVIGAFVNLHAVLRLLVHEDKPVHLLCAGTNGRITLDDCLCAGALATGLWEAAQQPTFTDDQTRLAMALYESAAGEPGGRKYRHFLRGSRGGTNLCRAGLEGDIDVAAQWDRFDIVPEFSPTQRRIVPATDVPKHKKHWLRSPLHSEEKTTTE